MFLFVSIIVPIAVYAIFYRIFGYHSKYQWLVVLAGALFCLAYYLPSPLIYGQQTQFITHFVGGGIFTGLLGLYIAKVQNWLPKPWYIEAFALFALVSALGVTNELFELIAHVTVNIPRDITDTSWDLAANTAGASFFYFIHKLVITVRR